MIHPQHGEGILGQATGATDMPANYLPVERYEVSA